jgi:peptide deformylase
MKLEIIKAPNDILNQKSEPVKKVSKELIEFGNNMIETMKEANGLGLSAVQVGRLIRVLCMKRGGKTLLMYNPIVLQKSNTRRMNKESCLSFDNVEYIIKRPTWVKVRYIDQQNKSKMAHLEDLDAVVFQHELSHLDGITFDQIEDKLPIVKNEET